MPGGHRVVDARGRFVTPGIIDVHSHLGVYPSPGVTGMSDGNEATSPNTAQVWAEPGVFQYPHGIAVDPAGNIYTAEISGNRVLQLRRDSV